MPAPYRISIRRNFFRLVEDADTTIILEQPYPAYKTKYLQNPVSETVEFVGDEAREILFPNRTGTLPGAQNSVNTPFALADLRDSTGAVFASFDALLGYLDQELGNFDGTGGAGLGEAVETIKQESDLIINIAGVASTTGNVTTVTGNLTLKWCANITSDHTWVMAGGTLHHVGLNIAGIGYVYSGAGTIHSGVGVVRILDGMNIGGTGGGTLINLTGSFNMIEGVITSLHLGVFSGGVFVWRFVIGENILSGFNLINPVSIDTLNIGLAPLDFDFTNPGFAGDLLTINTNRITSADINLVKGSFEPGASILNLNPRIFDGARFSISQCDPVGGELFKQTDTADIVVDDVNDASPVSAAITQMASNGMGGTTVSSAGLFFEDEIVTHTGFITPSYNGTFRIFNVVPSTSYDINVPFIGNDTGTADSFRLDLTVPSGHGITTGDNIKLDKSTFYNGFYVALTTGATSIVINGEFRNRDSCIIQNNVGLDQSDPRVLASDNPSFQDSKSIGSIDIQSNLAQTIPGVIDAYHDINFTGSTGGILSAADNGGGLVRITTDAVHNLNVRQKIKIRNTTLYNGIRRIIAVPAANQFDINVAFNNTVTGFWDAKIQPGCNMEGFRLLDQNTGDMEYIRPETLTGDVIQTLTGDRPGTSTPYEFTTAIDDVVPEEAASQPISLDNNRLRGITMEISVDLTQGQRIRPVGLEKAGGIARYTIDSLTFTVSG